MFSSRLAWLSAGTTCLLLTQVPVRAQVDSFACGDLRNPEYGPFDYRLASPDDRQLVEGAHFKPSLEYRFEPMRGRLPASDIDYTLRAFPNHPRALLAMTKLAERDKTERPKGANWAVECYFDRAIRFRADDSGVRLVYGMFLTKKGRKKEAIEQLRVSESLAGNDMNIQYNLGLAYFDAGDFEKSLSHAHKAYSLGFPLGGLKSRLERAGKWREPVAATVPSGAPAAPPATDSPPSK